jgi:hypothetical protein
MSAGQHRGALTAVDPAKAHRCWSKSLHSGQDDDDALEATPVGIAPNLVEDRGESTWSRTAGNQPGRGPRGINVVGDRGEDRGESTWSGIAEA